MSEEFASSEQEQKSGTNQLDSTRTDQARLRGSRMETGKGAIEGTRIVDPKQRRTNPSKESLNPVPPLVTYPFPNLELVDAAKDQGTKATRKSHLNELV
jgi:hypothetical protein